MKCKRCGKNFPFTKNHEMAMHVRVDCNAVHRNRTSPVVGKRLKSATAFDPLSIISSLDADRIQEEIDMIDLRRAATLHRFTIRTMR